MTRLNIPVRAPKAVHREIKDTARKEGLSVAEYLSRLVTEGRLAAVAASPWMTGSTCISPRTDDATTVRDAASALECRQWEVWLALHRIAVAEDGCPRAGEDTSRTKGEAGTGWRAFLMLQIRERGRKTVMGGVWKEAKRTRDSLGMTRREVSEASGVSCHRLGTYERGERAGSVSALEDVAGAIGVGVVSLLDEVIKASVPPKAQSARAGLIHPADIGVRILEIRRRLGLRQQDVADAVGISRGYLSKIERGESLVDLRLLKKVTDAFGDGDGDR
jgi:transcriptional regulator with XRE-family HTH domain